MKHDNTMKKITLLIVAIAAITTLSLPAQFARPAADEAKPKQKAKVSAEDLKKYDNNGDGKIDKDERAAMKADKAAAKEKKEVK